MRMLITVAELKDIAKRNYVDLLARLATGPSEKTIDLLIEKLEKGAVRAVGDSSEATSGLAFNCTMEIWKGCDGLLTEAKAFDLSLNAIRDDDLVQIVRTLLTLRLCAGYPLEVFTQSRSTIMMWLTWKETPAQ